MPKSAAGGNIFLKEKKKPGAAEAASKGSKGTRSLGVGAGARRSTKVYASGNDPDAGKKQSKVNPPGEDVQKKLKDYERLGMAGELDRERDRDKGRSGASLEQRRTGAPSEKEKRFKDYELKGQEPKKDK
jgi:hypothetical protein